MKKKQYAGNNACQIEPLCDIHMLLNRSSWWQPAGIFVYVTSASILGYFVPSIYIIYIYRPYIVLNMHFAVLIATIQQDKIGWIGRIYWYRLHMNVRVIRYYFHIFHSIYIYIEHNSLSTKVWPWYFIDWYEWAGIMCSFAIRFCINSDLSIDVADCYYYSCPWMTFRNGNLRSNYLKEIYDYYYYRYSNNFT